MKRQVSQSPMTHIEKWWQTLVIVIVVFNIILVGLAQSGAFKREALIFAFVISVGCGWLNLQFSKRLSCRISWREIIFLLLLFMLAGLLFFSPAEHAVLLGDSAIYPNTAASLKRTGSLIFEYTPFNGLTLPQKQLFHVPATRQFTSMTIKSYEGLVFSSYYLVDSNNNLIANSRQPATTVWMAFAACLGDMQAMFYVIPLFGVLSVFAIYFLGKRAFSPFVGAIAAIWLVLSFPQLHFSRTPYAEVLGEFFIISVLYAWVSYLQSPRHKRYLIVGVLSFVSAFSARIDSVIALISLSYLLFVLCSRRDVSGVLIVFGSTLGGLGYTVWTINRPYVGATLELMLGYQLNFVFTLLRWWWLCFLILAFGIGLWKQLRQHRHFFLYFKIFLTIALFLLLLYAYYIRPLFPEYAMIGGTLVRTYNEELLLVTSKYIPLSLFGLAALGLLLAVWQQTVKQEYSLLIFFLLPFALVFFWRYTTANIYPVALRRLVPEVLPLVTLWAGYSLDRLRCVVLPKKLAYIASLSVFAIVSVALLRLSVPYWFFKESSGTLNVIRGFHEQLPDSAIVIFEPLRQESVVGGFAAPLWSFYQHSTVLFATSEMEMPGIESLLQSALCQWQVQGYDIYVISQYQPSGWWPGEFLGIQIANVTWNSSMIGQSHIFPPYQWYFDFNFSIYHYPQISCP